MNVAQKDKVLALLKERGIELKVDACGCCDSPFVKITIDGEVVLDESGCNLPVDDAEREREERWLKAQGSSEG